METSETPLNPPLIIIVYTQGKSNLEMRPNVITTVAKPRVHVVILGCTIPAV